MKQITLIAVAGTLALAPCPAAAFDGNLVVCTPVGSTLASASIKPGLTCSLAKNKLQVAALLDGCTPNVSAPWDDWATAKINSKILAADAAQIGKVQLSIKGSAFASCDLTFSGDSFPAAAAMKITFLKSDGVTKIKNGKGQAFGKITADVGSATVAFEGVMTKGFGAGSQINVVVEIDLADPINGDTIGCTLNYASYCPVPGIDDPIEQINLKTSPASKFRIDIRNNAYCLGISDPYSCCTGAGVGNC